MNYTYIRLGKHVVDRVSVILISKYQIPELNKYSNRLGTRASDCLHNILYQKQYEIACIRWTTVFILEGLIKKAILKTKNQVIKFIKNSVYGFLKDLLNFFLNLIVRYKNRYFKATIVDPFFVNIYVYYQYKYLHFVIFKTTVK